MLQIRIHGRGGQGVVTAAELLSPVEPYLRAQRRFTNLFEPELRSETIALIPEQT
jgi:hypothetical protein